MTGLSHEFYLVSKDDRDIHDWTWCHEDKTGVVEIHDDLIHYMLDTLKWIPTYNPARKETCAGLCLYGPTIICWDGASMTVKILSAWISLFENGPETLQLSHYQQRLEVPRDVLIAKLRKLAEFAHHVVEHSEDFYILHLGL